MDRLNHLKSKFVRAAMMLLLTVMAFPTESWADVSSGYCGKPDGNEGENDTWKFESPYSDQYPKQIYATYVNNTSCNLTLPTGIRSYIVDRFDYNSVTIKSIGYLPKGEPILLERDLDTTIGEYVSEYTGNKVDISSGYMIYIIYDQPATGSQYVLYKDKFIKATKGTNLKGKVFFQSAGTAARVLNIVKGTDDATAIDATLTLGASTDKSVTVIYKIDGQEVGDNDPKPGTVKYKDGKITVTPEENYYLEKGDLEVNLTISASYAQARHTRGLDYEKALEVYDWEEGINTDPNKTTYYKIIEPGDEYDYEITANFHTRINISSAEVETEYSKYTYTQKSITPGFKYVKVNGTELGTGDYSVEYNNNINVPYGNDPKPTITITGKGKYLDECSTTFDIEPAEITKLTLVKDQLEYEVDKVEIAEIKAGDLTVPYEDINLSGDFATAPGNYSLTVTAKDNGNYKGKATALYTILPPTISAAELGLGLNKELGTYYNKSMPYLLPEDVVAYIVTGISGSNLVVKRISNIPKDVAVLVKLGTSNEECVDSGDGNILVGTDKEKDVSDITGGDVFVLYNGEFVKATSGTIPANRGYIVTASTGASNLSIVNERIKISCLLDGQPFSGTSEGKVVPSITQNSMTAFLTITPGSGNYFEFTKENPNDIMVYKSIIGSNAQTRMSGQESTGFNVPVEVKSSGTAALNSETTLKFDMTDDKYVYEVTVNFRSRKNIDAAAITLEKESYTYTGGDIKPKISKIVLGTTELQTTDYKVDYVYNINVPESNSNLKPRIEVSGIGKYKGSVIKPFDIEPKTIKNVTITLSPESFGFNGENHKPEVTVVDEEVDKDNPLVVNQDYTLTNNGGSEADNYPVTVTGKGNYKDSKTVYFSIEMYDVPDDKLNNISEETPAVSFVDNDVPRSVPDDKVAYIVTGVDNNKVTLVRVKVVPKGWPVILMDGPSNDVPVDIDDINPNDNWLKVSPAGGVDADKKTDASLYVVYKGEFVKATGIIPAGRIYLEVPYPNSARVLLIGGEATGIENVQSSIFNVLSNQWYDLQGRRIEKPTKAGLYIRRSADSSTQGKKSIVVMK